MTNRETTYDLKQVLSFAKTDGEYGLLSNMSSRAALMVNGIIVNSSEALYQAMKFPLFPKIQHDILCCSSPMEAKIVSRRYDDFKRQDWDRVKFAVMYWCLMVKLIQNQDTFGELLRKSGNRVIVEYSKRDGVWGACPIGNGMVRGINALGQLLMSVRDSFVLPDEIPEFVESPSVNGALLFDCPIERVFSAEYYFD